VDVSQIARAWCARSKLSGLALARAAARRLDEQYMRERRWDPMLWLRREEGQDLTEYALLIGLIVIICILAITLLGTSISQVLSGIASALQSALGGLG
jgi:Flp pilus assembly pilin Flp